MVDTLIARDSKGKIRQINISCEKEDGVYYLKRTSGLYGGKFTEQPTIIIDKGKVKRTIDEQAELVYNSNIKSYLDKGYRKISDFGFSSISEFNPEDVLPKDKTDQNGAKKPMLAKSMDLENKKLTDKEWLASYKHDGVRCSLFYKDGEVKTSSRGGQDYDIAALYIRKDPYIVYLLKKDPKLVLDGEIYRHGWPLNVISGLCRLETLEDRHKELEFRCYDIVDESISFKQRLAKLKEIKKDCPVGSRLIVINHFPVHGKEEIMNLHNKAVSEGYEGLVVRDPEALYKCGARDNRMMKIKLFTDAEFKITGLSEGLRDEDLCFTMETEEGYPFKAKPLGTREDKQWYRDHIKELIGKMGTVKFFGMTNTDCPVPNLPVFKCVRNDKDI